MISDSLKLASFDAIFAKALGGPEVAEMFLQYYEAGFSLQEVANMHQLKSAQQAKNVIGRAAATLKECGLWNPQWSE